MSIQIFTTGGTFDKVYFDAKSEFHFGDPIVGALLDEANVSFEYAIESLMQKDSLDMDAADRELIRDAVTGVDSNKILITHGTDTMVDTASVLLEISDKTIVLFGAMGNQYLIAVYAGNGVADQHPIGRIHIEAVFLHQWLDSIVEGNIGFLE